MTGFALAAVPFVMKIVMVVWVFAALALVLLILVQKGKGGGLSAAFGGIGGSLLGTKTGDFLTWVTISLVAIWLVLSVVAVKWYKPTASEYLQNGQAPAQSEQQPVGNQGGGETQKTKIPAPAK